MWSLGVVLYILLSGAFPFDEENLFDQVMSRGEQTESEVVGT
jgi:serine/threonine protein kinase